LTIAGGRTKLLLEHRQDLLQLFALLSIFALKTLQVVVVPFVIALFCSFQEVHSFDGTVELD
jgi:hypothetical protein